MSETGPSIDPSDPSAQVATPPQKKPGWFRRNILGVREEAPTGTDAEPTEEPEPTPDPEPILSEAEIAALEAEAGGDDEKLRSLIREACFMKEVGRLALRSENELDDLNPYKESDGYKKEKFKSSLRRRAVIKAIITGVVGTVGVGVAVATGGSALPVILGVAGKALGLGAMASFGAATAVDAKHILYDTDTNKERMAAIYAGRQRRMRDLARRVEETARKGFITEADGTIVNLAEAKGDLFSFVMKIDSPDQLEEGVDDEIIKENQEIAQLKEKMVASRKHQRNMKIGASLLAGVLAGGTELLHNIKELAHNIEAHGFEMHGAGLGAIVDRIREFQQDFVDVHHHFTQSVVTDSAGHTEAVFHTSQATHDAIHTAMDRDVDALGYPIDINDTYNGVYGDFRLPGVGHGGPWLHEVGDTMQQAFEKQAMEYANIVAAGELATCAVADGISEWAAHELSQKRFSTLEANRERRTDESFGVPGGAEEVFASVDHEMREKMGIGKELELKPDQIDIDKPGKKGKSEPVTYTKARNRFVLTSREGDTYIVSPMTSAFVAAGEPFELSEDEFDSFFTFKTNSPVPDPVPEPATTTPAPDLSGSTATEDDPDAAIANEEDDAAAAEAEDPATAASARPRPATPPPVTGGDKIVDAIVDGPDSPDRNVPGAREAVLKWEQDFKNRFSGKAITVVKGRNGFGSSGTVISDDLVDFMTNATNVGLFNVHFGCSDNDWEHIPEGATVTLNKLDANARQHNINGATTENLSVLSADPVVEEVSFGNLDSPFRREGFMTPSKFNRDEFAAKVGDPENEVVVRLAYGGLWQVTRIIDSGHGFRAEPYGAYTSRTSDEFNFDTLINPRAGTVSSRIGTDWYLRKKTQEPAGPLAPEPTAPVPPVPPAREPAPASGPEQSTLAKDGFEFFGSPTKQGLRIKTADTVSELNNNNFFEILPGTKVVLGEDGEKGMIWSVLGIRPSTEEGSDIILGVEVAGESMDIPFKSGELSQLLTSQAENLPLLRRSS